MSVKHLNKLVHQEKNKTRTPDDDLVANELERWADATSPPSHQPKRPHACDPLTRDLSQRDLWSVKATTSSTRCHSASDDSTETTLDPHRGSTAAVSIDETIPHDRSQTPPARLAQPRSGGSWIKFFRRRESKNTSSSVVVEIAESSANNQQEQKAVTTVIGSGKQPRVLPLLNLKNLASKKTSSSSSSSLSSSTEKCQGKSPSTNSCRLITPRSIRFETPSVRQDYPKFHPVRTKSDSQIGSAGRRSAFKPTDDWDQPPAVRRTHSTHIYRQSRPPVGKMVSQSSIVQNDIIKPDDYITNKKLTNNKFTKLTPLTLNEREKILQAQIRAFEHRKQNELSRLNTWKKRLSEKERYLIALEESIYAKASIASHVNNNNNKAKRTGRSCSLPATDKQTASSSSAVSRSGFLPLQHVQEQMLHHPINLYQLKDGTDPLTNAARTIQRSYRAMALRRHWKYFLVRIRSSRNVEKHLFHLEKLFESEQNYIDQLTCIVEKFSTPLTASNLHPPLLSQQEISLIFRNILVLYSEHKRFFACLSKAFSQNRASTSSSARSRDAMIVDLREPFQLLANCMHAYVEYIPPFNRALLAYNKALNRRNFAAFVQGVESTCSDNVRLSALLACPVQRFGQYLTLIQNICTFTSPNNVNAARTEHLVRKIVKVSKIINHEQTKSELSQQLSRMETTIVGLKHPLAQGDRRLVFKGMLGEEKKRSNFVCFLLTDMLLLTVKKSQSYKVKKIAYFPAATTSLELIEKPGVNLSQPHSFLVVVTPVFSPRSLSGSAPPPQLDRTHSSSALLVENNDSAGERKETAQTRSATNSPTISPRLIQLPGRSSPPQPSSPNLRYSPRRTVKLLLNAPSAQEKTKWCNAIKSIIYQHCWKLWWNNEITY